MTLVKGSVKDVVKRVLYLSEISSHELRNLRPQHVSSLSQMRVTHQHESRKLVSLVEQYLWHVENLKQYLSLGKNFIAVLSLADEGFVSNQFENIGLQACDSSLKSTFVFTFSVFTGLFKGLVKLRQIFKLFSFYKVKQVPSKLNQQYLPYIVLHLALLSE